jgi:hypothetical protein
MQDCIKMFSFDTQLAKSLTKTVVLTHNVLIFAGTADKMNFRIKKNREM